MIVHFNDGYDEPLCGERLRPGHVVMEPEQATRRTDACDGCTDLHRELQIAENPHDIYPHGEEDCYHGGEAYFAMY